MLFADAADGTITLTFSAQSLALWLAGGLGGFGSAIVFLLRWFLGRLDGKDKEHEAEIGRLVGNFQVAIREERERGERSETRQFALHERTITVVEGVKGSLDGVIDRLERVEAKMGVQAGGPRRGSGPLNPGG